MVFGMYGLEKVEYLGDVNGSWRGPETCLMYEFRRDSRVHWVDVRDVQHLLNIKGPNGEEFFRVIDEATA